MKAILFYFTKFFSPADFFFDNFFSRYWKYTVFSTFYDEFFSLFTILKFWAKREKLRAKRANRLAQTAEGAVSAESRITNFFFYKLCTLGKNPTGNSILGSSRMSWSNPVRKLPIEITQCARDFWRFAYLPLKIGSDIVARLKNHWDWTC